jgi:PAS domain S-box-containing protein
LNQGDGLSNELHRILRNQLLQHFGGTGSIPASLKPFIDSINRAYHELDCGYEHDHHASARVEIFRKCQAALLELAQLDTMDIESGLRKLVCAASDMFGVERVSVWFHESGGTAIECRMLYKRSQTAFESGMKLRARDYPRYFKAIASSRVLAANSAMHDPRTSEFSSSYLKPLGITSMMDVTIRHHGQVVGVLCHEHVGPAREWTLDEQEFAGSLAELISLTLEADQRRRTERDLEKLISLQTATLESTEDGILVVDREGKIVSFNRRFADMWRVPHGILARRNDDEALSYVLDQLVAPDEFVRKVRELYQQDDAESMDVLEFKDGRMIQRYSRPQRLNGRTVGRVWSFRDISDQRRSEQREADLRARLSRAARMESLGLLAGGVAHDLNNILGPLVGYPDLILEQIPPDSPLRADIEEIRESSLRAAALTQDLLTMARRGNYKLEPISLNTVVETYLGSASFDQLKERHPSVSFDFRLDPELLPVHASPIHLSQVVMNLVANACEAMTNDGLVTIATENRYFDLPTRGYDAIPEGEYTCLIVRDTGIGIPAENIERIFEPFYTSKQMGRSGTGLGLAIVYSVVKDLGGTIDVKSTPGQGSEFALLFPLHRDAVKEPDPANSPYRGSETILVVDDIKEQRTIVERMMSKLGYTVVSAADGHVAIDYLLRNDVDLVIMDMVLGTSMDGLETYRRILEIRPGKRCIIVSGFEPNDRVREAQGLGAGEYVRKPFTYERLSRAVWDHLHGAKSQNAKKT